MDASPGKPPDILPVGRIDAKPTPSSIFEPSVYICTLSCSFLWDKKAVLISSVGVHDLFIIRNGHTWISERSQGGFSGTDPVQIRGTATEYLLSKEYILSFTGFTSLAVFSACNALKVGVFGVY